MLSRAISFILDANVDVSVGRFLERRGHRVVFVLSSLPESTSDEVIAALGDEERAVVITHDRDFNLLVQRMPEGNRRRFRRLGRISLRCREPQALRRIEALIASIEFEYEQTQWLPDQRLIIDISTTTFTITR